MSLYRLIAFDFDGTLADSMPWFVSTLNQIASRHRFRQVTGAEVEMLRQRSSREILRHLGIRRWRMPFIARDLRRRSAEAAATGGIGLFPGIAEVFDALTAAGVLIAVVSSNGEETIRRVLGPAAAQVSHYFCLASLFGKARKFRQLSRRAGIPPAAILCVGDEVRDIEAAHAVGMPAAAVTWGCGSEAVLRAACPEAVFHSVEEMRLALLAA